jgi:hypothetical protein
VDGLLVVLWRRKQVWVSLIANAPRRAGIFWLPRSCQSLTMGKGSNVQKKQAAQLRNQKDKGKSDEERKAAADKAK